MNCGRAIVLITIRVAARRWARRADASRPASGERFPSPLLAMYSMRSSTPTWPESSSPISRRSRMTTTRWARRRTSSSSEEMKMTERPAAESSATLRWMSAFAPTSMPRVGSSRMSSSGAVASQRARSTFCWLPPDRVLTTASGFGRASRPSASMYSATTASRSALRILRRQPRRAWMPSTMFSATVRSETMPSARRSSEENAMRCSMAWRGSPIRPGSPLTEIDAGVGPVGPVEQAGELGATGAQQSGQAHDLPVEHLEVGRLEHPPAPDVRGLEDRHAGSVHLPVRGRRRSPPGRRARGRSSS